MKTLTNPEDFVGAYGAGRSAHWGILTDHLALAIEAGWKLQVLKDGSALMRTPDGDSAPLVCSEIIEIRTEDGLATGRCGEPAMQNKGGDWIWCAGHDMAAWTDDCPHGLSAALCAGPGHYPMDY